MRGCWEMKMERREKEMEGGGRDGEEEGEEEG